MCESPIFDKKCYVCRTVFKKVSFFIACFQKSVITTVKGYKINCPGKEGYAVSQLSGRLPDIIRDMVIYGMQWKEAAAKYAVSEAMLTKYRRKALSELAALYEGRARHTEEYLLS